MAKSNQSLKAIECIMRFSLSTYFKFNEMYHGKGNLHLRGQILGKKKSMNFWKIDEKKYIQNGNLVGVYLSTLNGL